MVSRRCSLRAESGFLLSRRDFLQGSAGLLLGSSLLAGCSSLWQKRLANLTPMHPGGPAAEYIPAINAAFVRREEEYGMWWPGAVYDGEGARRIYTEQLVRTAQSLGVKLDLRPKPIYSSQEAEAWVKAARAVRADGLMIVLLDRQKHAWPTANTAAGSGIPTVVFSPVGSSFTTNTVHLAEKPGCVIYSTDDFRQAAFGMKLLKAGAKLRRARCIVLKGDKRYDSWIQDLGITMRHVPAKTFLEEYDKIEETDDVLAMTNAYLNQARRRVGVTRKDVFNGTKAYFVARNILAREGGDAITMDCLGTLASSKESLPCLAWSRMNDEGVPAACEADFGAAASHIIVQYLFDRPGFQQDPVAETARGAIIGAHCSCPTRLQGFDRPPESFDLVHHHGNRDAVPRTLWPVGQRITCVDVLPGTQEAPTELLVSTGTVLENVDVPPAGGCVVSVMVKFDGGQNVLTFPGFHQLFFFGECKQELLNFCQLFRLKAQVV